MNFCFMTVHVLHSGHQHVLTTVLPYLGWRAKDYTYNYNVCKSLHSLKIMLFLVKVFNFFNTCCYFIIQT
jgi:hypothetical protein